MSFRSPILVLGILLMECGPDAGHAAIVAKPAPKTRPLLKSNLVLGCSHVVVQSDLIAGVLTARNTGSIPLALVQRWNSWGAYQWRWTLGGESAENPQWDWWANYYSEEVLAPGEIRHARFFITRSPGRARIGEKAWWFVVGGLDVNYSSPASSSPFVRGQAVTLVMDGSGKAAPVSDPSFTAALWVGTGTVPSGELESLQDLERRIQGELLG